MWYTARCLCTNKISIKQSRACFRIQDITERFIPDPVFEWSAPIDHSWVAHPVVPLAKKSRCSGVTPLWWILPLPTSGTINTTICISIGTIDTTFCMLAQLAPPLTLLTPKIAAGKNKSTFSGVGHHWHHHYYWYHILPAGTISTTVGTVDTQHCRWQT